MYVRSYLHPNDVFVLFFCCSLGCRVVLGVLIDRYYEDIGPYVMCSASYSYGVIGVEFYYEGYRTIRFYGFSVIQVLCGVVLYGYK